MSNESNGLEFNGNQEIVANVIKPEFEFKTSYTYDVDNNIPADSDEYRDADNFSYKNSDIDDNDTQGSNITIDIDKNTHAYETPKKGVPCVIQQKYGASMCN